ncbi:MAG: hypothetical protein A2005_05325 [Desulfuromonadales bacterium GWC2_61_20]|nr:MAG: hypothetical protein A2005_05325 [Desulfuromonadales bacterium GWC2_61_20]HAD03494.1 hypothetical protein [Desulfuromonas sp.]
MKVPQVTIYAKQAGVEIAPYVKRSDGRPDEGRIALRFFRLEGGASGLRFVVEPAEAFELYCRMRKVHKDGGKESLSHSFTGPEGEVQSRLTLESYSRAGKSGYALTLQRGSESINVPIAGERFLYAAEFLRHLALSEAWIAAPPSVPPSGRPA